MACNSNRNWNMKKCYCFTPKWIWPTKCDEISTWFECDNSLAAKICASFHDLIGSIIQYTKLFRFTSTSFTLNTFKITSSYFPFFICLHFKLSTQDNCLHLTHSHFSYQFCVIIFVSFYRNYVYLTVTAILM